MCTYIKTPTAKLDYGFDWSDWLGTGETLATSSWTVPTGITKISDAISSSTTVIWLSSGTHGSNYSLINHIKTNENREDDRTLIIKVRKR